MKFDVQHLNFYYGQTQALNDINLTLVDRQITAFIGPSGCGKSTLLRVFNRMYALYPGHRASGDVRLDGRGYPRTHGRRGGTALPRRHGVPEADTLSHVDLRQRRIRLAPSRRRISRSELTDRVEEALRDAAMWEEVKDKLHEDGRGLSGGQQQRLCIARTLAVQPGGAAVR